MDRHADACSRSTSGCCIGSTLHVSWFVPGANSPRDCQRTRGCGEPGAHCTPDGPTQPQCIVFISRIRSLSTARDRGTAGHRDVIADNDCVWQPEVSNHCAVLRCSVQGSGLNAAMGGNVHCVCRHAGIFPGQGRIARGRHLWRNTQNIVVHRGSRR